MISRSRVFFILLSSVGSLLFVLSILWLYDKNCEPWLYYQNRPFPLKAMQIYPGDVVPLEVERCNSTDENRTYRTTHNMRNEDTGIVTMLPDAKADIGPGCHRANSRLNVVPLSIAPGRYTSFGTAVINMWFSDREIRWDSEVYVILPAKIPALHANKL